MKRENNQTEVNLAEERFSEEPAVVPASQASARWPGLDHAESLEQNSSGTTCFTVGDTHINGRQYGEKQGGMENVLLDNPQENTHQERL